MNRRLMTTHESIKRPLTKPFYYAFPYAFTFFSVCFYIVFSHAGYLILTIVCDNIAKVMGNRRSGLPL